MQTNSAALLLALLIPGTASPGEDSEKLGRLFFTPEQRSTLDRQAGLAPFDAPPGRVTVDGEIWHQTQRRARWINGQDAAATGPSSIPVGDTYHRATGKRESLLGDGQLIIKPGGASK